MASSMSNRREHVSLCDSYLPCEYIKTVLFSILYDNFPTLVLHIFQLIYFSFLLANLTRTIRLSFNNHMWKFLEFKVISDSPYKITKNRNSSNDPNYYNLCWSIFLWNSQFSSYFHLFWEKIMIDWNPV